MNFTVKAGEALVLTGPNGSGKTTLLRVIAGLLRPSEGAVSFEGAGPDAMLGEEAHYLAHLDPLKPSLTIAENLMFWTEFLGGAGAGDEALRAVRLERLAQLPAGYLSAGQRRRLSLARLLAVRRPIWLLDEPTAALDAAGQVILADMMREHLARAVSSSPPPTGHWDWMARKPWRWARAGRLLPLPACGERSDCEAIRVRGRRRRVSSAWRGPLTRRAARADLSPRAGRG